MPTTTIAAIERHLDFRADPQRVWRALTDEQELAGWFGQSARLDLRSGGLGWIEFEGHGRFPIRVEEVDPPRRLAWRWGQAGDDEVSGPSTLVEWELERLPVGGTRLHLRESGFQTDEARWGNSEGWLTELSELSSHLAVEPWEAGIHRVEHLRSPLDRVWHALGNADGLASWWGGGTQTQLRDGAEGWWAWDHGRSAYRIETIEPPRYLCWSWVTAPEVSFADAEEVLRTEWALVPRDDGGTDLHLFESGFRGPKSAGENTEGWEVMLGRLRGTLGEG